jgi:hypothetical protein
VFGMPVVRRWWSRGLAGGWAGGGRWLVSGLVLGGLVVAALGVASAGVMQVRALMVGWCWRAGRGTDRWWRDWQWVLIVAGLMRS